MEFNEGDSVWVPDEFNAWLAARIISSSDTKIDVDTSEGIKTFHSKMKEFKQIGFCGGQVDAHVDNLVELDELSEGAILHHTRKRFVKKLIYTYVGAILVAVNPFEMLDIYGQKDISRAAVVAAGGTPEPHVFSVSATAFMQLRENKKNQSVLISGESGAGKTETTKKVLNYISTVARSKKSGDTNEPSIEDKILQSNPLLEAMGNAKTLRNNNSSRFGKWMRVNFDDTFHIKGCEIVNYLLEKSRVVHQIQNERNYHIFYQLIKGADAQLKSALYLLEPDQFRYLNQSGCTSINGVDDKVEFLDVLDALETLKFDGLICEQMFRIFSAILHLGNIVFESKDGGDTSHPSSQSENNVTAVVNLLCLPRDQFMKSLTSKTIMVGKETVDKPLSPKEADFNRDSLAMKLYGNLFDWVVQNVNKNLKNENPMPFFIGILDIFGFEVFQVNSFEQLCINYANEKLQFHFNDVIFGGEIMMYESEGVPAQTIKESIKFDDNSECVALIEGKPYGLLSLLEEECSLGNASDSSYANKIGKQFGSERSSTYNKFYTKHRTQPQLFSVRHFAGAVEYYVEDWLEKNRDTLSATSQQTMCQSALDLVRTLFEEKAPAPSEAAASPARSKAKTNKMTLGMQFRNQLIGLMSQLQVTEPHFIRCVKPNHEKVPSRFCGELVLRQLRYAGLFEAIRIRQSGFAFRSQHKQFADVFQIICEEVPLGRKKGRINNQQACQKILDEVTRLGKIVTKDWFVGKTKVFIKTGDQKIILERIKADRMVDYVIIGQAVIRSFLVRCKYYTVLMKMKYTRQQTAETKIRWYNAATTIQKVFRRYAVSIKVEALFDLIFLRRAVNSRNIELLEAMCVKIEKMEEREQAREAYDKKMQKKEAGRRSSRNVEGEAIRRRTSTMDFFAPTDGMSPTDGVAESKSQLEGVSEDDPLGMSTSMLSSQSMPSQSSQDISQMTHSESMQESAGDVSGTTAASIETKESEEAELAKGFMKGSYRRRSAHKRDKKAGKKSFFSYYDNKNSEFMDLFRREAANVKKVIKLLLIQNKFTALLKEAIDRDDVVMMNKIMIKIDKMGMEDNLVVQEASDKIERLHRKRKVMVKMAQFLQNEEQAADSNIVSVLAEAKALGVSDEYTNKVQRVYDSAGPRLKLRNKLRKAIELVDGRTMRLCLRDVDRWRKHNTEFASLEIKAARYMLRMLEFDRALDHTKVECEPSVLDAVAALEENRSRRSTLTLESPADEAVYKSRRNSMNEPTGPEYLEGKELDGPKLTRQIIDVCNALQEVPGNKLTQQRYFKYQLAQLCGNTHRMEEVVRCYKWQRSICTWKYAEGSDDPHAGLGFTPKSATRQREESEDYSSPMKPRRADDDVIDDAVALITGESTHVETSTYTEESVQGAFMRALDEAPDVPGISGLDVHSTGLPPQPPSEPLMPEDIDLAEPSLEAKPHSPPDGPGTESGMGEDMGEDMGEGMGAGMGESEWKEDLDGEPGSPPGDQDAARTSPGSDFANTPPGSDSANTPPESSRPKDEDIDTDSPETVSDEPSVHIDFSPLKEGPQAGPEGDFFGLMVSSAKVNPFLKKILRSPAPFLSKKKEVDQSLEDTLAAFDLSPTIAEEINRIGKDMKAGRVGNSSTNQNSVSATASPAKPELTLLSLKKSSKEPVYRHLSPRRKGGTYYQKKRVRSPSPPKAKLLSPRKRDEPFNARAWRP